MSHFMSVLAKYCDERDVTAIYHFPEADAVQAKYYGKVDMSDGTHRSLEAHVLQYPLLLQSLNWIMGEGPGSEKQLFCRHFEEMFTGFFDAVEEFGFCTF